MAQFKVGDRVRIVRVMKGDGPNCRNREATVWKTDIANCDALGRYFGCFLDIDGIGRTCPTSGLEWAAPSDWLAPLTPPAEDAWASEQVRKVCKPQHVEPVAPERERTV